MSTNLAKIVALIALTCGTAYGQEWQAYRNSPYGYTVEYPTDGFAVTRTEKGLTLLDDSGRGQIDVYGATNEGTLGPAEFAKAIVGSKPVRQITYTRRGTSWLVVSGYYKESDSDGRLVFYAKFLFSSDRSQISAFEASYPLADKRRFDAIVEHMENKLSPPQAAR